MKISLQNPTQGPLITVSFDDEVAAVAKAFSVIGASRVATAANNGLATLRTAAQFAKAAPGAGGGTASIAGPLALMGMLFAAGDSPQRKTTSEKIVQHSPSPAELRCLSNPYDSSTECAALRSMLTLLPFLGSPSNTPNAARASAAFATTSSVPMAVGLPTSVTQFAADVLAHIEASDGKRHSVPLAADEKQDLIALAQKVAAGEASDFDLGLHVWEILEGDMLQPLESQGFTIDLLDTPVGAIYTIHPTDPAAIHNPLYKELKAIQNAYERVLPDFRNRLLAWPALLIPSSVYLLGLLPFLREKMRFMVRDVSADDFHAHHSQDLSPVQTILNRSAWLSDLGFNVHGLGILLHDVWHAIMWEGQTPAVKTTALALYPTLKAVAQNFSEPDRRVLDDLIETVVQPPMGRSASAAEFIAKCLDNLRKSLRRATLPDRQP